jgi:uncharacterized protein (TIGR00251 family)
VKIKAKVIPNSKVEGVVKEGGGFLVRVKEPAREGRANKAVIKLLARHFGVSQRHIVISSGFGSRNKVIEVLNIQ